MSYSERFVEEAPTREAVDALPGPVVLEFGTGWCGHCQAAQPLVQAAFAGYPQVRHLRIEDGPGRRLGVLVHHDDAVREFAYDRESHIGRLARGLDEAAARGWVVVSMRNDWRVVHTPR